MGAPAAADRRTRLASTVRRAMYAEQQTQRGNANSGALSVTFRGDVSAADIKAACLMVVRRHPGLRTVVEPTPAGLLEHELCAAEAFAWSREDLSCAEGEEVASCRAWIAARYAMRPWDLTVESGIRFHLLEHGPDRQTLAIPVHHICFDGRSKFLFADEFCAVMDALREGRRSDDSPLGQREIEPSTDTQSALGEYWSDWNSGGEGRAACVNLPRVPSPIVAQGSIGRLEFGLPDRSVEDLKRTAHAAGTSFFGGLLAVAASVLWSYGNDRLMISLAVDASTADTTDCMGCGINAVPLSIKVDSEDDLLSLLDKSRRALERARRLRGVPFGEIVNDRNGPGELSEAFFDFAVSYLRLPLEHPSITGIDTEWDFLSPNFGSPFEVSLALRVEADASFGRVDYLRSVGSDRSAKALLDDFGIALDALARAPKTKVGEVPIDSVRLSSRPTFGPGTSSPRPDQLTGRDAAHLPGVIALEGDGISITYAELDERIVSLNPDFHRDEVNTDFPEVPADPLGALLAALTLVSTESSSTDGPRASSGDRLLQVARWLGDRSAGSGGRTLHRSAWGSRTYLAEALSTWATGGTLVLPPSGHPSLAEQLVATRADRVFIRPGEVPELIDAARKGVNYAPAIGIVVADEPWSREATSTALGSGIRLEAYLACDVAPIVLAMGRVETEGDFSLSPPMRDVAPGLEIEIATCDGRALRAGVAGLLTVGDSGRTVSTDLHARIGLTGGLEWLGHGSGAPPALSARIAEHAACLMSAPGVREVHIDVERGEGVSVRPKAYVAAHLDHDQSPKGLEMDLRRLTSTHHPLSGVTVLSQLPRDRDGSVDVLALRASDTTREVAAAFDRAIEVVCSAWADVFGEEEVSRDDDFFEAGGNSLLATRLLARIQDQMGVELSLRDLLDYPTVGELAEMVEREMEAR